MVRTLKGYVTVRSFNRMAIPVPVQNMILRNYSQTMGMSYALPYGEHKYEDCYMQLFATLKAIYVAHKLSESVSGIQRYCFL
jgi:sporadic carbohydrate cluster protein (TIGR04323 family)